MAVIVDKARRDDLAAGIDGLPGGAGQLAELGDLAVLDRDIADKRRHARAVDNPAILDQQVIRHRCSSSCPISPTRNCRYGPYKTLRAGWAPAPLTVEKTYYIMRLDIE
jgi:hypothetical protein